MKNVYVLTQHDGVWPDRVALVILAMDRYEAMDIAADACLEKGWDMGDFELSEAMELDGTEDAYKV